MAAPTVKVELAFGSTWQTEPSNRTWTDVTSYVLNKDRLVFSRGASAARGEIDTGSCSLSLKNTSRRFDPTYTSGPYYGQLKPGVPLRVSVVVGAAVTGSILMETGDTLLQETGDDLLLELSGAPFVPVWYGTVAAWPQKYDRGNRFAWVPVQAFDGFDKLSRAKLPRSVLAAEVLTDAPKAYWRMEQPAHGQPMIDSSGNNHHGVYVNPGSGESLVNDGGQSLTTVANGDSVGSFVGSGLPEVWPVTFEAWVKFDRDLAKTHMIVSVGKDTSFTSGVHFKVEKGGLGSPNGELILEFHRPGSIYFQIVGSSRVDDGMPHHVVFTMSSAIPSGMRLFVDGVQETTTVLTGLAGTSWVGFNQWGVGNAPDNTNGDYALVGAVDDTAIYNTALQPARVLAHYNAGHAPLSGQTADQRVGWILDEVGWPTGLRDFQTGGGPLGPALFREGDGALDVLRRTMQAEDGLLFVNASGSLRLYDRYWRWLNSLATTSQFTFTDQNTARGYGEFELSLDDELLVNVARVTRRDGAEQVASNTASVAAYGEAELQLSDLPLTDDRQAVSLAEWVVATRSTPLPRVPNIRVPLHRYSASDQNTVLQLEIGHRVTVNRTPQAVGSAISLDFHIAGISQEISESEWWWTAFVTPVPQSTVTPLLWDTGTWDSSAVLTY